MLRNGIALLIVCTKALMPVMDQSPNAIAKQENDELLEFPEAIATEVLASGVVGDTLSPENLIILERVILPVGGITTTRQVDILEVVYVEQGDLVLTDSIGLRSGLGEEGGVYLRSGASYAAENEGSVESVFLRLRVDAPTVSATPIASPVTESAPGQQTAGDEVVTLLAEFPVSQPANDGSTLYISRAILNPGDNSGQFALSESMVVLVESGTLTVASPSGLDGQLDEGHLVVLPVHQTLSIRNDGDDNASVMFFGIAPAYQSTISEAIPTPVPPRPAPEPTGEPLAESAEAPAIETAANEVLYEADTSGGFENWPTTGGWHLVSGMLVNDGTSNSAVVIAPPIDIWASDYAVEAEIQWNRDGGSFGVLGRWGDRGGYSAGYTTSSRYNRERIRLWGTDTNPIAEYRLELDNAWHVYRLEVRGNVVKVYVDGGLVLETADNSFLSPGQAGVWSNGAQINMRGFKVISLGEGTAQAPGGSEDQAVTARMDSRRHATVRLREVE